MIINELFSSTGTYLTSKGIKVLFDNIDDEICNQIELCDVVVGCSLSLTNTKIISALESKTDGVCIILDKKSVHKNKSFYDVINSRLTHYDFSPSSLNDPFIFVPVEVIDSTNQHPLRVFGLSVKPYKEEANGRVVERHPLFHHKFLIFCDKNSDNELTPKSVLTGSYNFTQNANYSRENAILFDSNELAKAYYSEWEKCALLSEPLNNYSEEDINPEFISESSFKELKNLNDTDNDRIEYAAAVAEYENDVRIGVYDNKYDQ